MKYTNMVFQLVEKANILDGTNAGRAKLAILRFECAIHITKDAFLADRRLREMDFWLNAVQEDLDKDTLKDKMLDALMENNGNDPEVIFSA